MPSEKREDTFSYGEKKRRRILQTAQQPVYAKLCRILCWAMWICTAFAVAADVVAYIRYDAHLGIRHMLVNAGTTGFYCWLLFGGALMLSSVLQMVEIRRRFALDNADADGVEGAARLAARVQAEKPFFRYIWMAGVGMAVWGLLYVLF